MMSKVLTQIYGVGQLVSTAGTVLLPLANGSAEAAGTVRDDIGWAKLYNEVGSSAMPTGVGVNVTIVEAAMPDGSTDLTRTYNYRTYPYVPPADQTTDSAKHANSSANWIFRGWNAIAPGINNIDCYDYGWLNAYFLTPGTPPPLTSPNGSRVANHSYVYTSGGSSYLNMAHRLDWVVAKDDYLQVVASNLSSGPVYMLGSAFNVIAVGRADGANAPGGTYPMDSVYAAGRYKPDIVAPMDTSNATNAVSGAAAVLIQVGHTQSSISKGSYVSPRTSQTIRYAETSETIKAVMMAGADRSYIDTNPYTPTTLSDYRALTSNQTANGLDKRYGAGQVNVYNSYRMLMAGQQRSAQDDAVGGGNILDRGFDYDDHFGGANGSNSAASYFFTAAPGGGKFIASLAWNVKIADGTPSVFDGTATLYDLDLRLLDLTAGSSTAALSASGIDNTENLWTDLVGGHNYQMQVYLKNGTPAFDWDYSLAWQTQNPVPEPASLLPLSFGLLVLRRPRWRGK